MEKASCFCSFAPNNLKESLVWFKQWLKLLFSWLHALWEKIGYLRNIDVDVSLLSCKPKQSKFPLIQPEMSGWSFSIILFIIFGENMAELPRAQKTRSADEKSSQQHLQIGSKSALKKYWLLWLNMKINNSNQELEPNKTTLIMWTQHFCFQLQNIVFFPLELWIIFTDWNSRLTRSWTEMLNPWDQDASSRINTHRPDPHATITLSPMCQ